MAAWLGKKHQSLRNYWLLAAKGDQLAVTWREAWRAYMARSVESCMSHFHTSEPVCAQSCNLSCSQLCTIEEIAVLANPKAKSSGRHLSPNILF
jgi:hypothetical protein